MRIKPFIGLFLNLVFLLGLISSEYTGAQRHIHIFTKSKTTIVSSVDHDLPPPVGEEHSDGASFIESLEFSQLLLKKFTFCFVTVDLMFHYVPDLLRGTDAYTYHYKPSRDIPVHISVFRI